MPVGADLGFGGQLDRLLQVTVLLARSRAELVENGQMLTRLVQLPRLHVGNANVLMSADVTPRTFSGFGSCSPAD